MALLLPLKLQQLISARMIRYKQFLQSLGSDKEFYIDQDAINQAIEANVEIPGYLSDQINALGTDAIITMEQFASDIVNNQELLDIVRPHTKLSSESINSRASETRSNFRS